MQVSANELANRFPNYLLDHDNAAFYAGWLERRLLINRCDDCHAFHHPPRWVCPTCWSFSVTPTEVSGRGTVYTKVALHQGPRAADVDYSVPYPVVAVDLDEQRGLRFASGVRGASHLDVHIGDRVRLDWISREDAPFPVFVLDRDAR